MRKKLRCAERLLSAGPFTILCGKQQEVHLHHSAQARECDMSPAHLTIGDDERNDFISPMYEAHGGQPQRNTKDGQALLQNGDVHPLHRGIVN